MRHHVYLLAAGTAALLASCREPVSPAALPMPAEPPQVPGKEEKALEAGNKRGRLSAIPLEVLFAKQQSGEVLLYDARPVFVAAFGKIPGAISWPKADFEKHLAEREPEIRSAGKAGKTVVIYCTDSACPDARTVAEKLAARGHDIAIFEGGYGEWKDAGMETE